MAKKQTKRTAVTAKNSNEPTLDELLDVRDWDYQEALIDALDAKLPRGLMDYQGPVNKQQEVIEKLREQLDAEEKKLRELLAPYYALRDAIQAITIKTAAPKPAAAPKKASAKKPAAKSSPKKPAPRKSAAQAKGPAAPAAKSEKKAAPAKKPKSGAQKRKEKAERQAAAAAFARDIELATALREQGQAVKFVDGRPQLTKSQRDGAEVMLAVKNPAPGARARKPNPALWDEIPLGTDSNQWSDKATDQLVALAATAYLDLADLPPHVAAAVVVERKAVARENDEAACDECGCMNDTPCPGGCQWVAHPLDPSLELCSSCLPKVEARVAANRAAVPNQPQPPTAAIGSATPGAIAANDPAARGIVNCDEVPPEIAAKAQRAKRSPFKSAVA